MDKNKNTLYIVGVGPGTEGLLTGEARELIESCSCFAGGRRQLALAPARAETHVIDADLLRARRFIAVGLERGDVCVLASGDPGSFGILPFLEEAFSGRIHVAPGISSVQLLSARLRIPWHDWSLVSLHGRQRELVPLPFSEAPTVYFCDHASSPDSIAGRLPTALAERHAVVGSELGLPDEQVWRGRLADAALMDFSGNSLLLLFPEQEPLVQTVSAPGIPDEAWLRCDGVPLSKSEVRAVLLAKAQPSGRRVIWDSGAGTGSYAIECALVEPGAYVYAIDKNSQACSVLADNARRFGAVVEPVNAEAPGCFANLPQPDLVIIGGNDGRLEQIFSAALQSLAPGGRLVVTALLEETKKKAHGLFAASGLENRAATRVAISRGEAQQWVEQNPVIIFTGDKPAGSHNP
ncbi:MAG: precorrin-6y C5,15-methyltransferase (decarboxylating) subunit CbiE [Thermoleophilia bacterium]|nr:precorrin-6y C5,15-methyltransferase (decarboxylating) subunit CbiE [Thermoleophilia bacterium]